MAKKEEKIKILTSQQEQFLEIFSKEETLCKKFYLTGGTPLAAFYLKHRISEDIDLFCDEEFSMLPIRVFLKKVQEKLKVQKINFREFLGLKTFELHFQDGTVLKVDFNYYPFPRIEKGIKYKNIQVDSILDIAVNKVHTIFMQPRVRDFVDIYFIIKEKNYSLQDLLMKAKAKFDWHIEPIELGKRLIQATELSDYPRMIKKINHSEWKTFFLNEAKKLKKEIFK